MDGINQTAMRDAGGRFVPGQSGNPADKKPGTRNQATLLAEALRDSEGEAAARLVIDKALAGDARTRRQTARAEGGAAGGCANEALSPRERVG